MDHRDFEAIYPLSPVQQGMLFHSQLSPSSEVYSVQVSWLLEGGLDVAAFKSAWERVMEHHAILRTCFHWKNLEKPLQLVRRSVDLPWVEVDWRDREPQRQADELEAWHREDRERGFDLGRAPLMRLTLIHLSDRSFRFIWTLHHILLDGWSLPLILNDVAALYDARVRGKDLDLPSPPPWRNYIAWLKKQDLAEAEAYWRRRLEGFGAPTRVGTDFSSVDPEDQSVRREELRMALSEESTRGLEGLAREHGLTLNTFIQGAWALLLSRYSGEEDVVFGATVSGRPAELDGVESMVGNFINALAMRVRLSASEPLLPWLKELQEQHAEARQYDYTPLVEVQGWSEISRGSALFESLVVFENYPARDSGGDRVIDLEMDDMQFVSHTHYPLHLRARPGGRLALDLISDPSRFSSSDAAEMLEQLRLLLEQMIERPEAVLGDYSLVTESSRAILPDPSVTLEEPRHRFVTECFAAHAARDPSHPALSCKGEIWSYGELAKNVDRLARLLLASELQRGEVVALAGPPSFGLIAAMLAVEFSGGVILTLDPRLPTQRKALMLREAGAQRLLSIDERPSADGWSPEDPVEVIHVHPWTGEVSGLNGGADPQAVDPPQLGPEDAAYIFFTSGTTGVPKGVLGSHRGLAHFLDWQRRTFDIGPADRCAQLTGLSFDVVLRDIFLPLTSGATLCLPDDDEARAPDRIAGWIEREKITLIHTVPTLAESWLGSGAEPVELPSLRYLFFAGEPLRGELIRRWSEAYGSGTEIVNLYGPTETTLAKCVFRVPGDPAPGVQPIGGPLPQTQALILAAQHRLCGVNEIGEIVIRTPFRSFGYLNAELENAERFVINPFTGEPKDLLYKTGDRGRYRSDGLLEILGRVDHRVKIRGVRVELDEISTVLNRHPALRQSVVLAREDEGTEKRLVAYVVADATDHRPSVSELRRHCAQHMPDILAPSVFVFLDQMPINPNGKINRRALPPPQGGRPDLECGYVAPRTPTEEVLVSIWASILGVARVGVDDNFFDLGGHSLTATRMVSSVRKRFHVDVPLRRAFERSTVAELSKLIEEILLQEIEDLSEEEAQGLAREKRQ
jgi:amino acid adenylation domain-containing protein